MRKLLLLSTLLLALPLGLLAQGTTWQTATLLTNGGTGSGTLDGSNGYAWFKIEVPEEGKVAFTETVTGNLQIYAMYLCFADGSERTRLGYYFGSGKTLEVTNVGQGTYYVGLQRHGGTGTYTLNYQFTASPYANDGEPNDEAAKAKEIGLNKTVQGRLGYQDANKYTDNDDWYKIVVPKDGRVDLEFTAEETYGLTSYAMFFHWYNEADSSYPERARKGYYFANGTLTITDAAAGTYYVRVNRHQNHGGYTLKYTFTPCSYTNDNEPNNDEGSGDTLESGKTVQGHLGFLDSNDKRDNDDWYKIVVPQDGRVDLTFNCEETYELQLYYVMMLWQDEEDGSYHERGRKGYYLSNDTLTVTDVAAGTYYVQLKRHTGHGGYKLKYIFTPCTYTNDNELNDQVGVGDTLKSGRTVQGHLGYLDDKNYRDNDDCYKIVVTKNGRVDLVFNCEETYGLTLYYVMLLRYNEEDGTYKERVRKGYYLKKDTLTISDVAAGTYYVQLKRHAGHGGYKLKYIFTPCPYGNDSEPNDDYGQGREIAVGQTVQGQLGYLDDTDYRDNSDCYKMVVPQDGRVQLAFDCEKTYDLTLYYVMLLRYNEEDSTYKERARKAYYLSKDTLTLNDMAAGTYYVQLLRHSGQGGYALKYIFKPNPYTNDTETNDELADVKKTIGVDGMVTGHLGYLDDHDKRDIEDWFRLDTSNAATLLTVTIEPDTLSNLEFYFVEIVKQKGDQTTSATRKGYYIKGASTLVVENVDDDATYYVHLQRHAGCGGYTVLYGAPERFVGSEIRIAYIGRNTTRLGIPSPYDVKVENIGSGRTGSFFVAIPATPDIEFLRAVIPTEEGKIEVDREDFAIYDSEEGDCAVFIIPDLGPFESYTFTVYMQGRVNDPARSLNAYAIPLGKAAMSLLGALKSTVKQVKDNFEWRAMMDDGITVATVQACIDAKFFTEKERQQYSQVIGKTEREYKTGYREPVAYPVVHYTSKVVEKLVEVGNPVVATFGALRASGQIANSLVNALRRKLWLWIYKDLGYVQDEPEVMDGRTGVNGIVRSWDPNEMVGPQGFGEKNYIAATKTMEYRILFENKSEATDNAYRIRISDALDKKVFDVNTVRFGATSHEGTEYNWNMTRSSNKLSWDIKGIELPPNVNAPEGEGYVSFSVDLLPDLKNGTEIKNKASIRFDSNETIETNEYVNTLDLEAPTTEMVGSAFQNGVATVTCKGSDKGSGISHYLFYASSGGGEYLYIGRNTEPSIDFSVKEGVDYSVYAVAIDNVGNVQKSVPQAISFNATGICTINMTPSTSWIITRLNGTVVASGQGTPDLQLPAGIYIVRQGNSTRKVMVK